MPETTHDGTESKNLLVEDQDKLLCKRLFQGEDRCGPLEQGIPVQWIRPTLEDCRLSMPLHEQVGICPHSCPRHVQPVLYTLYQGGGDF